eukprot:5747086-Amphidinium_carterae.1
MVNQKSMNIAPRMVSHSLTSARIVGLLISPIEHLWDTSVLTCSCPKKTHCKWLCMFWKFGKEFAQELNRDVSGGGWQLPHDYYGCLSITLLFSSLDQDAA